MTDQPRKRVTIDAPDGTTILAARHLDATEGRVQIGSTVDTATRSAITRVLGYIAKAHGSASLLASTAPLAAGLPQVQGRCPACGRTSLFLGDGGYVTCSIIDCPNPSAADELLHGDAQDQLARALGRERAARVIAHTLHAHGHTLAAVQSMTDEQLLAVPGIQETSLALIRARIPAPAATEATEPASCPVDHCDPDQCGLHTPNGCGWQDPAREQYATRAAAIRDQSALAQIRLHIAAHRPRLQYADPILLGRLEAVLRQVGELEAAGGGS
ncbi:DUF6085 family protein [Streptomyces mirabilis]|uniref:DUF6085 family protein n=1 Tax=Streptomyces mirabilis TaxID=68239 RepID=UPI00332D1F1F